mmetsp:Transcript_24087/g.37801  ORF Transcript_24087/g.37801 Transcript_24087/m.37801 type:complete len:473 (-) Transcript_24087:283-1701(-)
MEAVQNFIDHPAERDIPIVEILTDEMFEELMQDLADCGFEGLDKVRKYWSEQYKDRKLISGFLKDREIGSKRLASMPDRVTNTIYAADGKVHFRPTAINCYEVFFESKANWWQQWRNFMFKTKVEVYTDKKKSSSAPQLVAHLLEPIMKSKYPAISEEEQGISLPLQTVCLAMFDAILFHMLQSINGDKWQQLRQTLCQALYKHKDQQIITILAETYSSAAVVFLQEVAASFVEKVMARQAYYENFMILLPSRMDGKRDQNSIILARREFFAEESACDVTDEILGVVVGWQCSDGDLVAFTIFGKDGRSYLLVSFHGDTNGLATLPVVTAVDKVAKEKYPEHTLIFGLDANTYREHSASYQGVNNFHEFIQSKGMGSCWGKSPDPFNPTTCNARTYLQPQLNKAVGQNDKITKADKNLKDWIVFYESQMSSKDATKDNTGNRKYIEEMVFPTLDFPSDHAVVASTLSIRAPR